MRIKGENYITIQGWMRTNLNLKGNDLLVYAIIYGFSQTENQKFNGSLQYIADWCGATKQGVLRNIKNLLDAGLIEKNENYLNGVKIVEYHSTQFNGVLNSVEHPVKLSLTNNIDNNQINKKKELLISKDINNSEKVEEIKELYNLHCINLPKIYKLTDKRIKAIGSLLKKYSTEEIIQVFDIANESDFLMGRNDRGWKADLDFILREDKFINILEGKYSNKRKVNRAASDMGRTASRMTDDQKKKFKEDAQSGRAEKY